MDPIIKIGAPAPRFELIDLKGVMHTLEDLRGRIVVIDFWSAECDWCERLDGELIAWLEAWNEKVRVLWIASNASESRELIERIATMRNLPTVLLDDHQQVADLYGAETTPHFFVADSEGKLAYQGSWDDITFRQRVATQVYIPQVVAALSQGGTPQITQTRPYGCVLVRFSESNP